MSTRTFSRSAAAEGLTERINAIDLLDERVRRSASPAGPTEPGRYLEVQGPGQSLLVPLEEGVTRVGRGLAADLRLNEDSVSRRHAMLICDESGARILDDRSSNGTFVNGQRVEQAELKHGDVLELGRVLLRYLEV
ncbi:MAG: FHA domain-containing protein [Actinomycetota bacterium]|nr:FHA domain-containing protein [Actinomycetota bacterium]